MSELQKTERTLAMRSKIQKLEEFDDRYILLIILINNENVNY